MTIIYNIFKPMKEYTMNVTKKINRELMLDVQDTVCDHIKLIYAKFEDVDIFSFAYVNESDVAQIIEEMNSLYIPHAVTFIPKKVTVNSVHSRDSYKTNIIYVVSDDVDESMLDVYENQYEPWKPSTFGQVFPDNVNMYYYVGYTGNFYRASDEKVCAKILKEFICADNSLYYKMNDIAEKVDWLEITGSDYVPGNGDTKYYNIYLTSDEHQQLIDKNRSSYCNLETVLKIKGYTFENS